MPGVRLPWAPPSKCHLACGKTGIFGAYTCARVRRLGGWGSPCGTRAVRGSRSPVVPLAIPCSPGGRAEMGRATPAGHPGVGGGWPARSEGAGFFGCAPRSPVLPGAVPCAGSAYGHARVRVHPDVLSCAPDQGCFPAVGCVVRGMRYLSRSVHPSTRASWCARCTLCLPAEGDGAQRACGAMKVSVLTLAASRWGSRVPAARGLP